MAVYPVIQNPPPWNVLTELGTEITVAGRTVAAVVSTDPVTGYLELGSAGIEAYQPYALVHLPDLEGLGDLHGVEVVIDSKTYTVRNVAEKDNINLMRLNLRAR